MIAQAMAASMAGEGGPPAAPQPATSQPYTQPPPAAAGPWGQAPAAGAIPPPAPPSSQYPGAVPPATGAAPPASTNEGVVADPAVVSQLMEMGFEEDAVVAALVVNGGDMEAAMNSLLSA